jgi:nucleoside-diphosphate-sugar epimerase
MAENPQALNIFITGGDSGVGLVLAREAAKRGHKVFAASATGTKGAKRIRRVGAVAVYPELTREGSLRSAMMMARADVVVNCAPQDFLGLPQYRLDYDKTAHVLEDGTEALVAAAGKAGVKRIIHLSPAYVYGDTTSPVKEDAPVARSNKLLNHAAEAEEAVLEGGIPGYVVRSGFIYGGWHNAMHSLAEILRAGTGIAKGSGKASWIHEDDLASVLLKLVELGSDDAIANILNVSDGETMSHDAFVNLLGKLYGVGEPNSINPLVFPLRTNAIQLELLNQSTALDTSKAQQFLNWKPQTTSKEVGIEKSMVVWRALEAGDDTPDKSSSKALVKS